MIAIDLIKQQVLDADLKAMQQINFKEVYLEIQMQIQQYFSLLKK